MAAPIEAIVDLADNEVGTATMGYNGHQISKQAPRWVSVITAEANGSSNAAEILPCRKGGVIAGSLDTSSPQSSPQLIEGIYTEG